MKIAVHDNRQNGHALFAALQAAGHELTYTDRGDVLLTDSDVRDSPYLELCNAHKKVFLHPHGAGFIGLWDRHPHTRGQFVTGTAHAEVLKRAGYDGWVSVIGWHFSEIRPHTPRGLREGMKVLLAPTHAMAATGWIAPHIPPMTQKIHDWLCHMPVDLTVRTVERIDSLALKPNKRAVYTKGNGMLADALDAIRRADLVIGGVWTFPTLAVALGVPTVMYGAGKESEQYHDIVQFPLIADDCTSGWQLWRLMEKAMWDSRELTEWRQKFIGRPFDPHGFAQQFEEAVATW